MIRGNNPARDLSNVILSEKERQRRRGEGRGKEDRGGGGQNKLTLTKREIWEYKSVQEEKLF